jgi:hypothetical protein
MMLGEEQSPKRAKGKTMQPGRTLGFIVVFVGSLLATLTSVYANHFGRGYGMYSVTSETSVEASVRFEFMVRPPTGPAEVQCKVMSEGVPRSFQLFISSRTIDFQDIVTAKDRSKDTVTIEGELLSTMVLGEGLHSEHVMETAHFRVVAVDMKTPRGVGDSFTLEITYSTGQETGQLLAGLGFCGSPCIVTFEGDPLVTGDIVLHSASGE